MIGAAARRRARPDAGRKRRRIPTAAVPSFFTLLNLFAGFLAIVQVHEGRFVSACWLVVLAGVFDLFDGMMARLTRSQSAFGVELDSLADVVSFGIVPSYLVYVFGLSEQGALGVLVAALPALCGAVRLARFNVLFTGEKSSTFSGLPIPMQAATVVALVLNVERHDFQLYSPGGLNLLVPTVVVLAGLMVSTIPFDSGPRPSAFYVRAHPWRSLFYVACLLLVIVFQEVGLLIALASYLAIGIGEAILRFIRVVRTLPTGPAPPAVGGDDVAS
ncbi:MAG TPA: CDP-diacylglycerol--serine O-phosphatidyltransferase [Rhodothermales bacterium]|nr:CDP-diacylglycerol--serine O-phosphatidyltransferase [Rhodothermales bacterium]